MFEIESFMGRSAVCDCKNELLRFSLSMRYCSKLGRVSPPDVEDPGSIPGRGSAHKGWVVDKHLLTNKMVV